MRHEQLLTVDDLRARAKRRLPKVAFDFVDGGAETEQTVRENRRAFEELSLYPRVGTQIDGTDLTTRLLGLELALPVILGPCGMARVVNPEGDLAAARAAGAAGTVFALATRAGYSIEEVAAVSLGPLWFQVYNVGGKPSVQRAIDRAARAGYHALVLTFDTQARGARERDLRNGVSALLSSNRLRALPYVPQLLRTPRWFAGRVRDGLVPGAPNVLLEDGSPDPLAREVRAGSLGWDDIEWVRSLWDGPILVKGILHERDAERAVDCGVDGVIVSNHGGRQLDCAVATARALPRIVSAVDGRCEVLVDGGIRRGTDVIKAMSLGASAVLIGRPWMYALGAAGQKGIDSLLSMFRSDLDRGLRLMGCSRLSELTPDAVGPSSPARVGP